MPFRHFLRALGSFVICWPAIVGPAPATTAVTGIRDVTCEQAKEIVRERQGAPDFVIVDFRTPEMFAQAHLRGAICHDVFAADIDDWLTTLDKTKCYLIYCTVGHRSGIALAKMKAAGFVNIRHMNEGISRWKQMGYETVSGSAGEAAISRGT